MDYLYKAIQKETGVATPEQNPVVLVEERPLAPSMAAVPDKDSAKASAAEFSLESRTSTAAVGSSRRVPFPVKSERLYCQRTPKMTKERWNALEQFRVLRSRVLEMASTQDVHSLMITSALAAESKTTTSINLALVLSQVRGVRVCLVDADMRKAGVADALGVSFEKGLDDYLRTPTPLGDVLLQLTDSLYLIPSGSTDESSAEVLHSETMVGLVEELSKSFDIVIYDAPPLFPVADARILANLVDGALFCVRAGHTPDNVIQEAIELIRPRILGAVLVGAQVSSSGWYYYEHDVDGKE